MPQILYAADFSLHDEDTFREACKFAEAWKAKLLITHVDDTPLLALREELPKKVDPNQKLYDIFPEDLAIDYEYIPRAGDPAKVILDIERERDVDLIVLGTHGRKGIKRVFAGSVAEEVIRSAKCPVLTLLQTDPRLKFRMPPVKAKILVPTDYSVHSYAALDFASSLARVLSAGITILTVDDSTSKQTAEQDSEDVEHQAKLWEHLQKFKPTEPHVDFGHKLLSGPAAKQIIDYAKQENYDYVVLGTHGRTGVGRVLLGSVAEQVVRNVDCPVITVKPSNKLNSVFHYQHKATPS